MNVKLLLGIAFFVIGIFTAGYGLMRVGEPTGPDARVQADYNVPKLEQTFGRVALPVMAGLSLAIGGVLIGLGVGNWKHPRSHHEHGDEMVDPEGYHKMKHV
jgi:hypothetical protein